MAILLIDDDQELCELLLVFLQQEGFAAECMHRFDRDIWERLRERIELVVLDVGLPGLNGFDVLRIVRSHSNVPVLMLTARGDDIDRIVGLELGADDYLPKPCNPRELAARIRAILRRADGTSATQRSGAICISGISLDPGTRSVAKGENTLQMTSTEFNVLERLMRDAGQIVTKEALMRDALGRRLRPFDRAIDMHISSIRKKVGDDLVQTIRGLGYQFVRKG